jgi:putative DNA methylase
MALFSGFSRVVEADGTPVTVRSALMLINQVLDEVLAEQEGDFDVETRWAVAWFEQFGFDDGPYGSAETLSKAKNASLRRITEARIADVRSGKVRLLSVERSPDELVGAPIWTVTHAAARALEVGGDAAAANTIRRAGEQSDVVRELAYRLYGITIERDRAQDGLRYNALVVAWPEVVRLAQRADRGSQQALWTASGPEQPVR